MVSYLNKMIYILFLQNYNKMYGFNQKLFISKIWQKVIRYTSKIY